MRNEPSMDQSQAAGTLYVVATPIGNLEDMTFRAVRILQNVALIAAESAEHSRKLCRHYDIRARLISYNQHNHIARAPRLLRQLCSGRDVALVTSAGTPGVSDPGTLLVAEAASAGIAVVPIPGSSALTAALCSSGLRNDRFVFNGFLSSRPGKRRKELRQLAAVPWALVFFEAPHRLAASLQDQLEILGNRQAVLMRELTKIHEEILRGSLASILERIKGLEIPGEVTLIVAGAEREPRDKQTQEQEMSAKIAKCMKNHTGGVKENASRIAAQEGWPYRTVYKAVLSLKRSKGSA